MPNAPYAKESTKSSNGTTRRNNETTLQSSANESIERTTAFDATKSQAPINDEKPVKNLSDVFRDIDAKKIQSNTKDIEDESTNILQSRRNIQIDSNTTPTSTTTIKAIESTTKSAPHSDSSSVNNITSSTERANLLQSNQESVANIQSESESESKSKTESIAEVEAVTQKRHRRHRQQRYSNFYKSPKSNQFHAQ